MLGTRHSSMKTLSGLHGRHTRVLDGPKGDVIMPRKYNFCLICERDRPKGNLAR